VLGAKRPLKLRVAPTLYDNVPDLNILLDVGTGTKALPSMELTMPPLWTTRKRTLPVE